MEETKAQYNTRGQYEQLLISQEPRLSREIFSDDSLAGIEKYMFLFRFFFSRYVIFLLRRVHPRVHA